MRSILVIVVAALLLTGCGDNTPKPSAGVTLNRGNVGEPKSLDPQFATTQWEMNVANDLFTGLLVSGPDGNPLPGIAESWESSADGLVWTFHLRAAPWSDGTPVTAQDFVFAWQRMLDPKTAANYASMLYVFKNAQAINARKLPITALAARAIDARTLEVTLEHPAPYLVELMTHSTSFPLPRHVVEKFGADWSKVANFVGNGPFVPKEWIPNDHLTLVKNPRFHDAATVKLDVVNYYPTPDYEAAIKRVRAGELDLQNQFSAAQIDWLKKNMADALRQTPALIMHYVAINSQRKPFDDVRVREALNLAFDREAVTEKIRKMGDPPAYSIVPPGIANYPGGAKLAFFTLSPQDRITRAQSLMRAAGYGPDRPLRTTYTTNNSSDNKLLAPAIQQMFKKIYVDLEIVQAEPTVTYQKMQEHDFDLGYGAWIADYNDAYNFLGILLTSDSQMNYGQYRNPQYDRMMAASQAEPDIQKRGQLMLEAEKLALADFAMVPYRYSVTADLVQPYVKGWIANPKNVNMSRWLSIEGRP